MPFQNNTDISDFYVIGISYKKASVETREKFALGTETQRQMLAGAKKQFGCMLILSTCNRTEIYARSSSVAELKDYFLSHVKGTEEEFNTCYFQYSGKDALIHMFYVASGMDSQILGDIQIISQFRNSFTMSNEYNASDSFLQRLINILNQTSKRIKNETSLSSGTASVAYSAVQYILQYTGVSHAKVLLVGAGKIGTITCINLLKHINSVSVTVVNRNKSRSEKLAEKFNICYKDFECLSEECNKADIIIVATSAERPTLKMEHLDGAKGKKAVLDLSVPRNADPELAHKKDVQLVTIDELSVESEETLAIRKAGIEPAKQIIREQLSDFIEWLEVQKLSPIFQSIQANLSEIRKNELDYNQNKIAPDQQELIEHITQNIVNKVARKCINYLKENKDNLSAPKDVIHDIFGGTPQ